MADGSLRWIASDYVFVLIGGVPPFDLLQRIGVRLHGEPSSGRPIASGAGA